MSRMLRGFAAVALVMTAGGAGCAGAPAAPVSQSPPLTAAPITLGAEPPAVAPITLATTPATPDLTNLARDAVVRVRNVACLAVGTAFFTADGALITNRHVIAASRQVQLSTWDGTDTGGVISGVSAQNDLARLSSTAGRPSKLGLASADPSPGERVWVAGYPNGDQLQLTQGTVIDEVNGTTFGQSGKVIRSNAPIKPGNSGSPVLDATGQVVGVAFAIERATGDALIISTSSLQRFLSTAQALVPQPPGCQ